MPSGDGGRGPTSSSDVASWRPTWLAGDSALTGRADVHREMAQRVKCSLCKPKNVHLDAQAHTKAGQGSEGICNFKATPITIRGPGGRSPEAHGPASRAYAMTSKRSLTQTS